MKRSLGIAAIVVVSLAGILAASVAAQGPGTAPPQGGITASGDSISFQGRLYNSANAPLINTTVNMRFSICTNSTCTAEVWAAEVTVTTDSGGYFSVLLGGSGAGDPFDADDFTGNRWLGIWVCNATNESPCASGWDAMDDPAFQPLTSVAIAVGNIRKNMVDTSTASSAGYVLNVTNSGSGWGLQGTSTSNSGVYGESVSGIGVEGFASSSTADVDGVFGYAASTASPWRAPNGVSTGATGSVQTVGDYGVFGINAYAGDGYGVVGAASGTSINLPPTGSSAGVVGSVLTADDYGVFGSNSDVTGRALGVVGVASTSNIYLPPAGCSAGVLGSVSRSTDYAVHGINGSATGGFGVYGEGYWGVTGLGNDVGVYGLAVDYGGTGTYGEGTTGVAGYSTEGRGVFGQTDYNAASRGQAVVGYASAIGSNVHGVYGVVAPTTSWWVPTAPAGVAGYVESATGIGVWGKNGSLGGGYGVYGESSAGSGYGVYGYNSAAGVGAYGQSQSGHGVYGYTSAASNYYGAVYGYAPNYWGVYGRSNSNSGAGVVAHNWLGGPALLIYAYSGNMIEAYDDDPWSSPVRRFRVDQGGNVYATSYNIGSLAGEDHPLYGIASPQAWFEDFGSATLIDGRAEVTIEPQFASTVNLTEDYHVFLTPRGDCQGLYIAVTGPTSFEVRELGGGKSDIVFDYRIVAKRRGYETLRMQAVPEPTPAGEKAEAPSAQSPVGVTKATGASQPPANGTSISSVRQTRPVQLRAVPAQPK